MKCVLDYEQKMRKIQVFSQDVSPKSSRIGD